MPSRASRLNPFLAASALALSACAAAPKPSASEMAMLAVDTTKPIVPASAEERAAADRQPVLEQANFWRTEYEKNPNDYEAALKFARTLRAIGSSARAVEVASQALTLRSGDVELGLVLAQAALDVGKPEDAAAALVRVEAAGQTDWRVMSIIGVVLDQLGKHADAQNYYRKALALSPDNPKVLTNLGLSYTLAGKPEEGERVLREASERVDADVRVRQNLALVLGVQGKFAEAEKAIGEDSTPSQAQASTAYFRALLTPARKWDGLRGAQN